jgi:hypothetical protein
LQYNGKNLVWVIEVKVRGQGYGGAGGRINTGKVIEVIEVILI